jgi:hypothetical protein
MVVHQLGRSQIKIEVSSMKHQLFNRGRYGGNANSYVYAITIRESYETANLRRTVKIDRLNEAEGRMSGRYWFAGLSYRDGSLPRNDFL